MKKYSIYGLVIITLAISCTRDYDVKMNEQKDFSSTSFIKVYNGVVAASRNYVYANNQALNGAALSLGSVFPNTTSYSAIHSGLTPIVIKDTQSTTTQTPISFAPTLEAGKYYSVLMYDTVNAVKYKFVEDIIEIPADTSARIRFANLVFSKTAVPNVDLYSANLKKNLFTNVAIGDITNFLAFPSKKSDSLFVRETGTANTLNGLVFTPGEKRSYTILFRGRYQSIPPASGTIPAIARRMDLYFNW